MKKTNQNACFFVNFAIIFAIFFLYTILFFGNKLGMKRFIVFVLLGIFLFSVSLFKKEFDFSKFEDVSVQVFLSNRNYKKLNNYSTVNNGQGAIIYCDNTEYKKIKTECGDISGVTFIFSGDKDTLKDIEKGLNVKILKCSQNEFTGYTNYFDETIFLENKKVNVQAVLYDNKIYVGFPLLLGSYNK